MFQEKLWSLNPQYNMNLMFKDSPKNNVLGWDTMIPNQNYETVRSRASTYRAPKTLTRYKKKRAPKNSNAWFTKVLQIIVKNTSFTEIKTCKINVKKKKKSCCNVFSNLFIYLNLHINWSMNTFALIFDFKQVQSRVYSHYIV